MAAGARKLHQRLAVPLQAKPAQALKDGLHCRLRRAFAVRVLDAQEEPALVVACEGPAEERRPGAPDVEVAGGRGREAGNDGLGHGRQACKHAAGTAQGQGRPVAEAGVVDVAEVGHRRAEPSPQPAASARLPGRTRGLRASAARALDERRLFVLLPFAIILGLVASTAARIDPDPFALGAVGAAAAAAVVLTRRRLGVLRLAVLAAATWVGFALLTVHGALFGTPMLDRPVFGTYSARIDEMLSEGAGGRRLVVSDLRPLDGARELPVRRARLALGEGGVLASGDTISGRFRFAPVPGPAVPGGFDTQFHAYFDGIGAYATAIGPVGLVTPGEPALPGRLIEGVRRGIGARIDAALAQPASGIARALITGDQSGVAEDAREAMARAGLAHVLSISGLHLTIVAGGVFAALRIALSFWTGLSRRLSAKRLAAVAGIVAALLYFAISGGNVAALRATMMIVLVFGAVLVGRRALTMRNVAIAALLVILTDPASVFRPSFQLSFAAVVALIGAWELSRGREGAERTFPRQIVGYFQGLAVTSLVAGAATLLFSVYHFQQTSPLGVVGNLLTLPLVGFVMMPAAVLAVLAMPLGLEVPFLNAMAWSIDRMLDLARLVSGLSSGFDASPLLTPVALLFGLLALCWFAFLKDRWRLLGPALAVPSVLLFGIDRPPDVLISDTTQALAVRLDGGLGLVRGKPTSFAVGVWAETYGGPISAAGASDPVRCDSVGCIAKSPVGFTVAVIEDVSGFYEDCGSVDLVVTRRRAPVACAAPVVIDGADLARGGVHWLRWEGGRFEVRSAIDDPERAWRVVR